MKLQAVQQDERGHQSWYSLLHSATVYISIYAPVRAESVQNSLLNLFIAMEMHRSDDSASQLSTAQSLTSSSEGKLTYLQSCAEFAFNIRHVLTKVRCAR